MNGTARRSSSAPYQLSVSSTRSAPITSETVLAGAGCQRPHRAQRAALLAEVPLDGADPGARPQRRRRQLAHAEAILERRQRLVERVLEAGDEPELVDPAVSST